MKNKLYAIKIQVVHGQRANCNCSYCRTVRQITPNLKLHPRKHLKNTNVSGGLLIPLVIYNIRSLYKIYFGQCFLTTIREGPEFSWPEIMYYIRLPPPSI